MMSNENYIAIEQLCNSYKIESSFIIQLNEFGLISIAQIEHNYYIHEEQLNDLEKIIRMHYDLEINLEGIETVLHLLKKLETLQGELRSIKHHQSNDNSALPKN